MKLEFSKQTFEKYWNIKFHENLASGGGVFFQENRQTSKQDEAIKVFY